MRRRIFAVATIFFGIGFVLSAMMFGVDQRKYAALYDGGIFVDGKGHPDIFVGQHARSSLYQWGALYTNEHNNSIWVYTDSRPLISNYPLPIVILENVRWADGQKLQNFAAEQIMIHLISKDTLQIWQQPVYRTSRNIDDFRWRITWTDLQGTTMVFYTNTQPVSMWQPHGPSGEENILVKMTNAYSPQEKSDYTTYYIGGPLNSFIFEEHKNGVWKPLK